MTHRWNQTIQIDEQLAKNLIQSQFNLPVESIQLLDQGWDNFVYLVNDTLIFRFPRREAGLPCMENEITLLPFVAQQVHFPLPALQWIGQASEPYPYPFAGYPLLEGIPLAEASDQLVNDPAFATTLGGWLKELHSIPVRNGDKSAVKGDQEWRLNREHRIKRCHENLNEYGEYFQEAGLEKDLLLQVIHQLSQASFNLNKSSYVNGDLYPRHLLIDPKTQMPQGIIDWGDMHINHPGIDLSIGMVFTKPVYQEFLNAYGEVDQNTLNISLLNSFAHAMSFLPYAYVQDKESLKRWAGFQISRAIEEILKV